MRVILSVLRAAFVEHYRREPAQDARPHFSIRRERAVQGFFK